MMKNVARLSVAALVVAGLAAAPLAQANSFEDQVRADYLSAREQIDSPALVDGQVQRAASDRLQAEQRGQSQGKGRDFLSIRENIDSQDYIAYRSQEAQRNLAVAREHAPQAGQTPVDHLGHRLNLDSPENLQRVISEVQAQQALRAQQAQL
jgi:hypothetical protein